VRATVEQAHPSRARSELRLPAQPSELARARRYAHEAAAAFGLDEERCYEVVFAVNEAVTNAIRHGRPDEQGCIELSACSDGERLTLIVCDHGTFVPPAAVEGGPSCEGGRGFPLMAGLMDTVELHTLPGCTTVCLSKVRM
jgi:anti-sigma regulatory factor (Ser/Thr protein kinase)